MTSTASHRRDRRMTGWPIDAPAAAHLLRRARSAPPDERDDAVDWAFAALPEHKHPRRLKIRQLLDAGDGEAADALIAQGLLQRPTEPALMLLRAESLLMRGRAREANREIGLLLKRRPEHVATLLLAARIASTLHDRPRAVELLRQASALRPARDDIRELLVRALIEAENLQGAARTLQTMHRPSVLLRAHVLRVQGRVLEAVELIEEARRDASGDEEAPDLACALIDLLERTGDIPRLRRLLETIKTDRPVVRLRAARSWLLLGAFQKAMRRAASVCRPGPHQRDALAVLLVAGSMVGRTRLARRALGRLTETTAGADPTAMADLWRRALTARLLADQCSGRRAGADRNAGLLRPLLRSAAEVFEGQRAARARKSRHAGNAELDRHLSLCLAALGSAAQSAGLLRRTGTPAEPPSPDVPITPIRKAA